MKNKNVAEITNDLNALSFRLKNDAACSTQPVKIIFLTCLGQFKNIFFFFLNTQFFSTCMKNQLKLVVINV